MSIIDHIARSCNISRDDARHEYDAAIENLRELSALGDLSYEDVTDTCQGLGLEADFVEYLLLAIA